MHQFLLIADQSSTLASLLAVSLAIPLYQLIIKPYPDTEISIKLPEGLDIKGKDVVYVHQFYAGISTSFVSYDQLLLNLLLVLGELKSLRPQSITLLLPYLPYARQKIMSQTILQLLLDIGVDKMITYDVHMSALIQQSIIPVYHIESTLCWVNIIKQYMPDFDNLCIAAPDLGGIARASAIAQELKVPLISLTKKRMDNGQIQLVAMQGNVSGKKVVIIDDMLDTGKTAIAACNFLLQQGAVSVSGCFSHALFSAGAFELLQESAFEKVFIGNSLLFDQAVFNNKFVVVDQMKAAEAALQALLT